MYCRLTNAPTLETDEKTQSILDEQWHAFTKWRPTKVNARLCRLVSKEGDTLHVATDVTYKDVVARRWRQNLPPETAPFQVVTALALTETKDGHLVLIPRDSGDWEASLECPGGFIRASHLTDNTLSIHDFIQNRVRKDLRIQPDEIVATTYLTTYDATHILEHMLVYQVTLRHTRQELQALHPAFVIVPPDYTPKNHRQYTDQPLHSPTHGALLATDIF